jgi:hypothetical protein
MPSAQNKLVRLVNWLTKAISLNTPVPGSKQAHLFTWKNFSFALNQQAYNRDICSHIVSEEQC